ncbi:hypothetical protein JCM11251_005471 [Rhodosporidiobolus azoricus]
MQCSSELSWNCSDVRDGGALFPLESPTLAALGGTWKWGWVELGAEGAKSVMGVTWKGVSNIVNVAGGQIIFKPSYGSPSGMSISPGPFPPSPSGSLRTLPFDGFSVCQATFSLTLVYELACSQEETEEEKQLVGGEGLAARFAAISLTSTPHDVLLQFPRSGHELWSSEAVLRASSYFEDLFSSGFSETATSSQSVGFKAAKKGLPSKTFVDSDDEDDRSPYLPKPRSHASTTSAASVSFPHITVAITEAAFSTYLAVVCFLQCGSVTFATLKSARTDSGQASDGAPKPKNRRRNRNRQSSAPTTKPTLPHPVSPKSVYRLAHFLSLPTLCTLALDNYRSQLTPSNATVELFDPFCALYPEAKDAVLDYIAANKREVGEAEATRQRLEKVEAQQQDGGGEQAEEAVWASLAKRLLETR